jgi:hypothetical protein
LFFILQGMTAKSCLTWTFFFLLLFICAYKAWVISPPYPHPRCFVFEIHLIPGASVAAQGRDTDLWAFYYFTDCPSQSLSLFMFTSGGSHPCGHCGWSPRTFSAVIFQIPQVAQSQNLPPKHWLQAASET